LSVQIRRLTGDGPTSTNITDLNTRCNAEDVHSTAGTNNPILVPTAGTNYSYWVTTRLYYDGSGVGTIDNIEWFTDGTNNLGTGVGCHGNDADGYTQATGTPGETGNELTTVAYASLSGAPVDVFDFTTASPKSISGSVVDPDSELFGDSMVFQITVGTTAGSGPTGTETFTWRYDSTIA
jgi:hypothetical protein